MVKMFRVIFVLDLLFTKIKVDNQPVAQTSSKPMGNQAWIDDEEFCISLEKVDFDILRIMLFSASKNGNFSFLFDWMDPVLFLEATRDFISKSAFRACFFGVYPFKVENWIFIEIILNIRIVNHILSLIFSDYNGILLVVMTAFPVFCISRFPITVIMMPKCWFLAINCQVKCYKC